MALAQGKQATKVTLDSKDCGKFRSLLKGKNELFWSNKLKEVHIEVSSQECIFQLSSIDSSESLRIHRGYPNTFIVTLLQPSDKLSLVTRFKGQKVKFRSGKEFRSATLNEKIFSTPQVEFNCSTSGSCNLVLTPDLKNP